MVAPPPPFQVSHETPTLNAAPLPLHQTICAAAAAAAAKTTPLLLQVLLLEDGGPSTPLKVSPEATNVRLEELAVIDMAFLAPSSRTAAAAAAAGSSAAAAAGDHAVLALLYEDNKQARHIKTYTLNLHTKVGAVLEGAGGGWGGGDSGHGGVGWQ